jgi:hypothetical protein
LPRDHSLVKELRGSLQAFFWQGLARLFGSNLKTEYEAEGQDQMIEQIVRQIEKLLLSKSIIADKIEVLKE